VNDSLILGEHAASATAQTPSALDGVRIDFPCGQANPPMMIESVDAGVDVVEWALRNQAFLRERLPRHGAIVFRGFADDASFERFVAATSGGALPYTERSSPRSKVAANIYTSTEYPPRLSIFLHNEQSYNRAFPRKIYFMCTQPALTLGATPLGDCRRLLRRLDPAIRSRFAERKYMYVRNFGGGMGLEWQDVFQTDDRREVEAYCAANAISCEWRGSDELRTRQVREVIARHPDTGELTWFNHLTFFHVDTLPPALRDALLSASEMEDLPNNTYYGDGTQIEDSVMQELRGLYESEQVAVPWRQNDILMVDNMLTSHGREPFTGPRRVLAAMADLCPWSSVQVHAQELLAPDSVL
jgi:alpha-ketoglutarate-dependent taurine dioxygenase